MGAAQAGARLRLCSCGKQAPHLRRLLALPGICSKAGALALSFLPPLLFKKKNLFSQEQFADTHTEGNVRGSLDALCKLRS